MTKNNSIVAMAVLALMLVYSYTGAGDLTQQQEAAQTAKIFIKTLGKAMKFELQNNGPVAAIKVCSEQAPKIAGELSRRTGWKITRVGTRVRNPMLGMPDAWEQQVLAQFQNRHAKGENFENMTHAELVNEPGGQYFRFMKAIGTKPLCLTCHGEVEKMHTAVRTILEQRYPFDEAFGYKRGDLRGAVSIKYSNQSM